MRNFLFIKFLITLSLLLSQPLLAQEEKATIKASRIFGDQNNNIINAVGNVEVNKNTQTLTTHKIQYNKDSGWIKANSNIELIDLNIGNLFADKGSFKDDFSAGFFEESLFIFNNGSYIKSKKAEKTSIDLTKFYNPIYSICPNSEIVKNDSNVGLEKDLITLHSKETIIDNKEDRVKNKHVFIKILNVPVLYTPYLSLPGKKKQRQSGFLTPSYTNNSRLRFGIKAPYFININEYTNLIITPSLYSSNGQFQIHNQLNQELEHGRHNTSLELSNNEINFTSDIKTPNRTEADLRYKFSTQGDFTYSKNSSVNFDILTVGDKDYLKDYNFHFHPYTQSQINYEHTDKRNFLKISSIKFQELENNNVRDRAQWVLPSITHHIQSKPKHLHEIYSLTSNVTAINRENGIQYRRLTTIPKINLPTSFYGNLLNFEIANQIDLYDIEYNFDNNAPSNQLRNFQSNQRPSFSAEWRLPLAKQKNKKTYVVEPKIRYDIAHSKKDVLLLPNEDSNNSELTINNLFVHDRIAGYDRNEDGQKISYGIYSTIYQDKSNFAFDIGQSLLIKNDTKDISVSGYNNSKKSNIVGKISYEYDELLHLSYNYQLDESNFNNKINYISAGINYKKFSFNNDHLLIRRGVVSKKKRAQNTSKFKYKFNSKSSITASLTKNLVTRKNLIRRISYRHDNCCVITEFSISEFNFSRLAKKERSINLNFIIKDL